MSVNPYQAPAGAEQREGVAARVPGSVNIPAESRPTILTGLHVASFGYAVALVASLAAVGCYAMLGPSYVTALVPVVLLGSVITVVGLAFWTTVRHARKPLCWATLLLQIVSLLGSCVYLNAVFGGGVRSGLFHLFGASVIATQLTSHALVALIVRRWSAELGVMNSKTASELAVIGYAVCAAVHSAFELGRGAWLEPETHALTLLISGAAAFSAHWVAIRALTRMIRGGHPQGRRAAGTAPRQV